MIRKTNIFILLFLSAALVRNSFAYNAAKDSTSAYLAISFESQAMFKDAASQSEIKSRIENIFKDNGINIIREERPEDYKLNINITIKDSLIIDAIGTDAGAAGNSIVFVSYPRMSFPVKAEKDIYKAIKKTIGVYKIGNRKDNK